MFLVLCQSLSAFPYRAVAPCILLEVVIAHHWHNWGYGRQGVLVGLLWSQVRIFRCE